MNNRDRFRHVLRFERVDRLPRFEWAIWWDATIRRWEGEGLPHYRSAYNDYGVTAIMEFFGLDPAWQGLPPTAKPSLPEGLFGHYQGPVSDLASYEALREHLFPRDIDWELCFPAEIRRRHEAGDLAVWYSLPGFFGYQRHLMGVMRHFYAFYDHPGLLKRINEDVLAFDLWAVEEIARFIEPDFMTIGEDVTYNHGPMLSREQFDEFMAPYYRELTPRIAAHNSVPMVDSDGNVNALCTWLYECGVQGLLPFEQQAGSDLEAVRGRHPDFRIIGGFNKLAMTQGVEAMRAEWERLLPLMRRGGFIPSVDHQTPPGVSIDQYRDYLTLMWEYTERAAE